METKGTELLQPSRSQATYIVPGALDLLQIIPELEKNLAAFLGSSMRPSPAKVLADFAFLPPLQQEGALRVLQSQNEFVKEAIRKGLHAFNEHALVRMAMRKLNLFSDENILEQVDQTDVVEIIDSNQIQMYRSFSCFALCNYSIAELVTYPWYELYDRPSWVTDKLFELGTPVLKGDRPYQDLEENVPPYLIRETRTDEQSAFMVQEKFYARMMSSHTREPYLLSVKRIKEVEAPTSSLNFL